MLAFLHHEDLLLYDGEVVPWKQQRNQRFSLRKGAFLIPHTSFFTNICSLEEAEAKMTSGIKVWRFEVH